MEATVNRDERAAELHRAWSALKSQRKVRQRDAADLLGVSEAELLASAIGEGVTRLAGDLRAVLKRAPELGRVMALTRNESCVHEKTGVYENLEAESMVGLALGADIDLRLFFAHWKHGLAVREAGAHGETRSLQFYDGAGQAVHKIFLKEGSDAGAFDRIVGDFAAPDQSRGLEVSPRGAGEAEGGDERVDAPAFRDAWASLKDTHEFFGLLRKFGVTRTQAFRLAGYDFAYPAPHDAPRRLLDDVAATKLPIMVFVGNPGCIQIHTGPVQRIVPIDHWLNVLDPGFSLHLRADQVDAAWVVKKPTVDGVVTSLELFDRHGGTIAMLFGQRKPGVPEMPDWQATVERLFPLPAAA
jgi:putative hemin transport protein